MGEVKATSLLGNKIGGMVRGAYDKNIGNIGIMVEIGEAKHGPLKKSLVVGRNHIFG